MVVEVICQMLREIKKRWQNGQGKAFQASKTPKFVDVYQDEEQYWVRSFLAEEQYWVRSFSVDGGLSPVKVSVSTPNQEFIWVLDSQTKRWHCGSRSASSIQELLSIHGLSWEES